ncbi:hypothetical protein QYH69_35725 [Paraburkholderia sp. SARCC-3016]|uniref:hypothetical protein n=1 Tax=Paraburkholderia sp. SARCC-3016 TaxID=3058611 RepID=UPI002808421E|nr:hypothetical protein [Paraburkholderia sp. SARCC-3016]MDQ7982542.1 hypothetical protein [Paraburkholderia sp. SARCC-3016]
MPQQHQFPPAPLHTNAPSGRLAPTPSFGSFHDDRSGSLLDAISDAINRRQISHQIVDAPVNWHKSTSNVGHILREGLKGVQAAEVSALQGLLPEQGPEIDGTRSQIDEFIRTGDLPEPHSPDAAQIVQLASSDISPQPPRTGPTALQQLPHASEVVRATSSRTHARRGGASQAENLDTPTARRNAVIRAMLAIWANDTPSEHERLANSAANSLMRNLISVMLPTMLRQIIAQEFATYSEERFSENGQIAFALIVAMIPPVLLIAGHQVNSGRPTRNANISRNTLALASIAAVAAAAGTGTLGSAAPAVFAFLLYAGMRDSAQSFIRLADPGNDDLIPVRTSATSASAYAAYQIAAGELTANRESPSGAGAAGLPLAARNSVLRGFTNQLVETADDLTLGALAAHAAGNQPLKLTLSGRTPSWQQGLSTLTTTFPARATLATAGTLASGAISSALAHTGLDTATQNRLSNVLGSILLGLMYPAFIHINEEIPPEQTRRENPSRLTPSTLERGAITPAIVVTNPDDHNAMEMLRPGGDAVSYASATGSMRSAGVFERGDDHAPATPSVRTARTTSSGTSVMRSTGNFDRGPSTGRRRLPQNDD